MEKLTRGIRNCNPTNIRRGSNWRGLLTVRTWFLCSSMKSESYDPVFCQFENMIYGVRAFLCLMRTYVKKHNVRTVRQFVHRFCPNGDGNNSETAYCSYILGYLRDCQDFEISLDDDFLGIFSDVKHLQEYSFSLAFTFTAAVCQIESNYVLPSKIFVDAVKRI